MVFHQKDANGIANSEDLDGVSPSVFHCTTIPMETGPIVTCVKT